MLLQAICGTSEWARKNIPALWVEQLPPSVFWAAPLVETVDTTPGSTVMPQPQGTHPRATLTNFTLRPAHVAASSLPAPLSCPAARDPPPAPAVPREQPQPAALAPTLPQQQPQSAAESAAPTPTPALPLHALDLQRTVLQR